LYNTNPLPFAICVLTLFVDLEQQGSSALKKKKEIDASVFARRKKNKKKVAHGVVIKEVTTRANNSNFVGLEDFLVSSSWKKENEK